MGNNAVDSHPKRDEIIEHLLLADIPMTEMAGIYGVEYDALTWYKRQYLKDQIKGVQQELKEEGAQELRVLMYKYIDVINALLQKAAEDIKHGKIQARTVNDIVKLTDLATRITGEQVFRVEMKQTWGDKMDKSPRFGKGKVYSALDLEAMR